MLKQTEPTASSSSGDLRLEIVPRDSLDLVWPFARPLILESFSKTGYAVSVAEVYGWLLAGTALLWLCREGEYWRGIVMTGMQIDPDGSQHLEIIVLSGNMPENWYTLEKTLILHANEHGCSSLRSRARNGWIRKMKPFGWRPAWTLMELRLDGR